MRYITLAHLATACKDQRELFREEFGERAELIPENWQRAIDAGLAVEWLVRWLRESTYNQYAEVERKAQDRYEGAKDPHWEYYHPSMRQAAEEYRTVTRKALFEALLAQEDKP